MNSHKERLDVIKGKNVSRNHFSRSSTKCSTSRLTENEHKLYRLDSHSDDDIASRGTRSPVYMNVSKDRDHPDGAESPIYEEQKKRSTKSMERLPTNTQSRQQTMKSNGSRHYMNMYNPNSSHGNHIYKSQTLNAEKASSPNKVLMKSSIQQEFHDKAIQKYFRGVTYGKARKPCIIATVMFILFGLFFLTGVVVICLTYLYQNIMPSLDIGEGVGPALAAGSVIFLGVGIKFVYDAHKLSRKERRKIGYQCYNKNYVGVKPKTNNAQMAKEKLVSGSTTKQGLNRVPKNINPSHYENQNTLGRSKNNLRTDNTSNV